MLVTVLILAGCEDEMPDYYDSRSYALRDFEAVELGDALQVEIIQNDEYSVVARGETPDIEDLELRVEDGVLTGNYRHGSRNHKRTNVTIFMPRLKAVTMEAATDTKISGFSVAEDLFLLRLSGASTARVVANFEVLEARIDGASRLILRGEGDVLDVVVGGASGLDGKDFNVSSATLEVDGASEALVTVYDQLKGSVQGSSLLRYYGSPGTVDVYVATGSRMSRL